MLRGGKTAAVIPYLATFALERATRQPAGRPFAQPDR